MAALAHTQTADSLAQQLHVALDKGLTASQVEKNQCKYGKNEGEDKATTYVEPIVILAILIANAWVGVVQETNAEKAIEALMEYSPDEAKVICDRRGQKIHAVDLVPGMSSRLQLATGSLPTAASVSNLTGVVQDEKAVKQDMVNMLFSGTTVVTGKAQALVVATGTQTAISDIHTSITSQTSEKTPLKQKLATVIAVICVLVWVVNFRNLNDPSHTSAL
ncbi:Calcium-transporting ATPase [Rhodotorula toruloides]|nr:Calcium-transporting ATPase [Rhodotorula toruloides]